MTQINTTITNSHVHYSHHYLLIDVGFGIKFQSRTIFSRKTRSKKIHFYRLYIKFSFFTTQKIRVSHPGVILFSKIAFKSKKLKKNQKFTK